MAGLGGELRPANHIERRISEAAKLGFSKIIIPAVRAPAATGRLAGINIVPCRTIYDALQAVLGSFVTQQHPRHQDAVEEQEESFIG